MVDKDSGQRTEQPKPQKTKMPWWAEVIGVLVAALALGQSWRLLNLLPKETIEIDPPKKAEAKEDPSKKETPNEVNPPEIKFLKDVLSAIKDLYTVMLGIQLEFFPTQTEAQILAGRSPSVLVLLENAIEHSGAKDPLSPEQKMEAVRVFAKIKENFEEVRSEDFPGKATNLWDTLVWLADIRIGARLDKGLGR